MKNDTYSSAVREHMKTILEKPAGYLSSRASFCERHDIGWGQRIIGSLILICLCVVVSYQVGLWISHHR